MTSLPVAEGLTMNDMMDRMMDTSGWNAIVVALWVVVLAVAVAVVLIALRVFADRGPQRRGADEGRAILDERYGRGEIDLDEYEERRRTIRAGRR